MEPIQLLGTIAAILTTVSFWPQVVKIWRSKQAGDLSLPSFLMFATGVLLWLIYGILRKDVPVAAANGVTLILATAVLGLTWRYGRKR